METFQGEKGVLRATINQVYPVLIVIVEYVSPFLVRAFLYPNSGTVQFAVNEIYNFIINLELFNRNKI